MKTFPVVFHVGLHKSGTTWLQTGLFSEHPQIRLVTDYRNPWGDEFLRYLIKASDHDFCPTICRRILLQKIAKLQRGRQSCVPLVSAERLSGHPYSGAWDRRILAGRMKSSFPEARVIVGIRNQPDMLISIYKQLVKDGYIGTFRQMLTTQWWQATGFTLEIYKYDALLELYWSLFSRKRVLVLFYEELAANPSNVLKSVTSFLNLTDFTPSNVSRRTNPSLDNAKVRVRKVLNRFRTTESNPFPMVAISAGTLRRFEKMVSLFVPAREVASKEDLGIIRSYYHESNERLRKMVRRSLPLYP
jgi:hypothetical protein